MTSNGQSQPIWLDYSTLSTFQTCQEKARLAYENGFRSLIEPPPLSFGRAIHAGVETFWRLSGESRPYRIDQACHAFLKSARTNDNLPTDIEADEKRSLDRGIALIEAYCQRYETDVYENVPSFDANKPYVEVGFAVHLLDYRDKSGVMHPVMYVGRIDRIMRSRVTCKFAIFEVKTTSRGLYTYQNSVKPNHQITGYYFGAKTLLGEDTQVEGVYVDAIFVSSRQPSKKFPTGVDIDEDFGRFFTQRSQGDVEDWLHDMQTTALTLLQLKDVAGILDPWPRNAPTACSMYGGCQYRELCALRNDSSYRERMFKVERWEPWVGIAEEVVA